MQRINKALEAIRRAGFADEAGAVAPAPAPAPAPQAAPQAPAAPEDTSPRRTLHRKLKLSLEEAALGCTKTLRGKIVEPCPACDGASYRVLGGACRQCQGEGSVRERTWFGWMASSTDCEACAATGVAREPCAACHGTGKADEIRYTVSVRIPPGVHHGDELFVDGRHHRTRALPGDFDIHIEVAPHAFFRVDDDGTVRCEVPVDGFAWLAGRSVEVPTLDGLQTLRLNRDQRCYRLERCGFPVQRRGERGACIVDVQPVFPPTLSADQQILLDQLIATTTAGAAADSPLAQWQRTLRSWQRGLPTRAAKAAST